MNPGPMTEPTVFYVRSLLAKLAIFLPPSMSQTTDGEHIRSQSPDAALRLNCISKSSKRRSASSQRRGGVNGAAAHWLILTKNQAARANSVRLDLALILLPGSSTSGPGVLGTLPCSEQVTVETDRPPILSYQASGFSAGLFSIHPMALLAQIAGSEHRPGIDGTNVVSRTNGANAAPEPTEPTEPTKPTKSPSLDDGLLG